MARKNVDGHDFDVPLGGSRHSLGSLGRFLKGKGIAKADLVVSGMPCLRYAEIYTSYGAVAKQLQSFVSEEQATRALPLEHGDIIFAASGETAAEIGKAVAYLGNGKAVVGGDTVVLRGHGQDPTFLAHALNAEDAVRQKSRLGKGQSVVHIHAPDLSTVEVWLPPLTEQRAIGRILRTSDEAIENVQRSIELLQKQYLAIRDDIIDWSSQEQSELQDFLRPVVRPVAKPSKPYRALSIRSHGKGSFVRVVANPDTVDMDTLYVAKAGDLIVNITFAWEGAIALVPPDHDGCLVSHRFPTFVSNAAIANARYLRHAVRMPRFTHLLALVSPGGAGRNRVLNKRDLLGLRVPLPNLSMQEKIAGALDAAEKAIEIAIKHKEVLSRQKRGLMQKLVTGALRVGTQNAEVTCTPEPEGLNP